MPKQEGVSKEKVWVALTYEDVSVIAEVCHLWGVPLEIQHSFDLNIFPLLVLSFGRGLDFWVEM